ncbi:hypothetical Protein psc1_00250 [Candidatus Phytoplasma solani]
MKFDIPFKIKVKQLKNISKKLKQKFIITSKIGIDHNTGKIMT